MTRGRPAILRAARCTVALGLTVLLTSCGAGLDRLPLSGPNSAAGDTYGIVAAFVNALNLPQQAKVKLNGADIGEVSAIRVRDFTAYVEMRINRAVVLPQGSTAELRSATPLGDLFVAIRSNADSGAARPALRNGDTIGVGSTTAAATIEELLSSAALLVNGGTIRQLTSVVNGSGTALGGRGANIAALLQHSSNLVSRLSARSDQMVATMRSTSDLAAVLNDRKDTLRTALNAAAPATAALADDTNKVADLITTLARTTRQLQRLPSVQGTDSRSMIADLNRLSQVFNDIAVDPNISLNELNRVLPIAMKFTNSTSAHANLIVPQLALGSLPDKNFPGDPAMHGPDGTDWHLMIGSLRYEWNLLLSKAFGPGRDGRPAPEADGGVVAPVPVGPASDAVPRP